MFKHKNTDEENANYFKIFIRVQQHQKYAPKQKVLRYLDYAAPLNAKTTTNSSTPTTGADIVSQCWSVA